jgi:hypothetical protein
MKQHVDPQGSVRRFKKQLDNTLLNAARAGRDISPVVADLLVIFQKESES